MSKQQEEIDWQHIAKELARNVNMALTYLKAPPGSGMLMRKNKDGNNEMRHWKEYFADSLELIPGIEVDREAMYAVDLPKRERKKYFKVRNK